MARRTGYLARLVDPGAGAERARAPYRRQFGVRMLEDADAVHEPEAAAVEPVAGHVARPAPVPAPSDRVRVADAGPPSAQLPRVHRALETTDRAATSRALAPRPAPPPEARRDAERIGERAPSKLATAGKLPSASLRGAAERAVAAVVGDVADAQRAAVRRLLADAREQVRPLRDERESRTAALRPQAQAPQRALLLTPVAPPGRAVPSPRTSLVQERVEGRRAGLLTLPPAVRIGSIDVHVTSPAPPLPGPFPPAPVDIAPAPAVAPVRRERLSRPAAVFGLAQG